MTRKVFGKLPGVHEAVPKGVEAHECPCGDFERSVVKGDLREAAWHATHRNWFEAANARFGITNKVKGIVAHPSDVRDPPTQPSAPQKRLPSRFKHKSAKGGG